MQNSQITSSRRASYKKAGPNRNNKNTQAISRQEVRLMIRAAEAAHIERKFCDKSYTIGVDYNGAVDYLLDSLSRGDTSTTCTGNLIRVRHIELRGVMYTNQTYTSMRLIVFKFRDSTSPAEWDLSIPRYSECSLFSSLNR